MRVEAYFKNLKQANRAIEELNIRGIRAWNDLMDDVEGLSNTLGTNSIAKAPANSSIVLDYEDFSKSEDISPLAAASPMVSGMGGFEEIVDINAKIAAVGDKNIILEIVEKMGGSMEAPVVNIKNNIEK